ncbi:MAG: ferritin-like domain-containing protein [Polyangiaceae bacterium]|jgi:uncharacterized ferritin-like protein (DUF455 family)
MDATSFVLDLDSFRAERMGPIVGAGQLSLSQPELGETRAMLLIALANEISVSELAAAWVPTTREIDVKIAFARQAGDEANHFQLVSDRLTALHIDTSSFRAPVNSPLFEYLKGLRETVERVAAGLFALESIAYAVNETFMAFSAACGDDETVRIYRECIQPDEHAHHQLGKRLLERHATTQELQRASRETVGRVLEIATSSRAQAAARIGSACIPGC